MKKVIVSILFIVVNTINIQAQSGACCPEFELKFKRDAGCLRYGICEGAQESGFTASMCKFSTNTFLITPNLPGYTYAWSITGGVFSPSGLTTSATNPSTITWGGGNMGTITITITSADGKCVKKIKEIICLRDAPKALFTFTPNNACAGTLINFYNTSIGGAAVSWDFGDGSLAGNVNNPTHTYTAPGTYNVTITVYSDTSDCRPSEPAATGTTQPQKPCCGCVSTYTLPVTVVAGNPLSIIPKECINQCICPGDTVEYCASKICGPYNWSVTGGTIISGAGTSCIKVVWGNTYPTTVQLVQPGCGNPCSDTSVLQVPVLVNNIPISPNVTTVCQNSVQTYSLPAMPGAFYNWTITGGVIVGPNQNTSSVTVNWGYGSMGQIACTYSNPLKPGCSGTSVLNVTIKPVLKIYGLSQTCEGCAFNLFAGNSSVTWSGPAGVSFSPATGSSTLVSFPSTGVMSSYTITASSAAFCNSPQSQTITVAPQPVLSITPASVQACPGTPVKFVATSSVTKGNVNWILPVGATMIANTGPQKDTAIIMFTTLPATITVEQTCEFNLACSKGTATATINKPPVPVIAPSITNPCVDQTVTYTVSNAVSGVYYQWSISSTLGTIVSGQGTSSVQILWHGGSPNTANLTVSNCAGTSIPLTISVTIPQFPTISLSGTCIKTGITLTSSTAVSYLWNTGATSQSITVTNPGTYTVTINPSGAGSCAQSKSITVLPNPYWVKIIPPCSVESCNPNSLSVLLSVSTNINSPSNCQWMFDAAGGPVSFVPISTTCGNYTATAAGSYYLVMTDPNGCKDTSNIIRIPEDINICCSTATCSALNNTSFNFTHNGCAPTSFTGSPLVLPAGWTTGSLHPTICYGDGTADDFVSLHTTHQYPQAGQYTACVVQKVIKTGTNDTCCISTCRDVTIPVVAKFDAVYNCNTGIMTITDLSSYYPSAAGASYSWTITGGTYTGTLTNGPNQSISPTSSGTFIITQTITLNGCTSSYTKSVVVVIPAAPITATPNPGCYGAPIHFSTIPGVSCYWQFGDGKFSYTNVTEHIYAAPGSYTVTLTTTTPEGCVASSSTVIVIQPRPIVTIAPNNQTVCPESPVTLTASINANGNTMCPALSGYTLQWYHNGTPYGTPSSSASLTTSQYGSYYAVLTNTNPGCNCVITTDTALIKWYPQPIAKIKGKSTVCLSGGFGTINLSNTIGTYATYNWSSSNTGAISFNPNGTPSTTATITATGNYQIFLEVIDSNGCKAYDTLCIYAANKPTALITPPGGALCEGNTYLLTAYASPSAAPPAGYSYLWNTNATTPSISVSSAGIYYAIVTDMNTGCFGTTNLVTINKLPNLSLFPSCCDTICSDKPINISVPLPLAPGENICNKYNIVWLDNNVPISPQPSPCNILNTASLTPQSGMHNISIVVTLNGCTDTSNVFSLYIKECGCDCSGSKWGAIELSIAKNQQPAKVVKKTTDNLSDVVALKCNNNYILKCNTTYNLSATFFCKDSTCPATVTYLLTPPSGVPVSGSAPLVFTPAQSGTYTVMLYGWCNGIKCDSCSITFKVECDDVKPCNCKGSKWTSKTITINNITKPLECQKLYDKIKCKTPINVNAIYKCADSSCNGTATYSLYSISPYNIIATGTLPLNYTPTQNGTYGITIYGWCGGQKCDSCSIRLVVEGCDTVSCCPYEIKVTPKDIKYTTEANATILNTNFGISLPPAANITEVRANVISYTIDDAYKGDCMKCINLPFTWASIAGANNIGTAPPQITTFGGVSVPSFNGSGSGAYQNPREVIWNNGTNLNNPSLSNIGMSFILPPPPAIDCCELKGKICVKFVFRDNDCRECEALACFEFVIKKR